MRALVFLGILAGSGYTAAVMLYARHHADGHGHGHGTAWNGLLPVVIVGGIAFVVLFALTMYDALIGGFTDDRP